MMRRQRRRSRFAWFGDAVASGLQNGISGGMNEHDYDGKCPNGCPMCTPNYGKTECGHAAIYLTEHGCSMCDATREGGYMPLNRVNKAYKSFVTIMDLIPDQGDLTSESMALEAIDDILSAWLDARETRELIRYIVTGVRTGDIAPDAQFEIDKTRSYLLDQGLI